MKTQDPHQDLLDAFEPAPAPPLGPDGAPQISPQRADPPARPSLCAAGPCRRYHRLVTQVDAAKPGAVRLPIALPPGTPGATETPQGTLYRAPASFHVQTHHYCYPDTGIEMPLGDLPVVECNRWEPWLPAGTVVRGSFTSCGSMADLSRSAFWGTEEGQRLRAEISAWEAARTAEAIQTETVDVLIARTMVEAPRVACQVCGFRFEESELDIEARCPGCRAAPLKNYPTTTTTKETP